MLLNELVCWDPPALPFTVFFELYKNISWYMLYIIEMLRVILARYTYKTFIRVN